MRGYFLLGSVILFFAGSVGVARPQRTPEPLAELDTPRSNEAEVELVTPTGLRSNEPLAEPDTPTGRRRIEAEAELEQPERGKRIISVGEADPGWIRFRDSSGRMVEMSLEEYDRLNQGPPRPIPTLGMPTEEVNSNATTSPISTTSTPAVSLPASTTPANTFLSATPPPAPPPAPIPDTPPPSAPPPSTQVGGTETGGSTADSSSSTASSTSASSGTSGGESTSTHVAAVPPSSPTVVVPDKTEGSPTPTEATVIKDSSKDPVVTTNPFVTGSGRVFTASETKSETKTETEPSIDSNPGPAPEMGASPGIGKDREALILAESMKDSGRAPEGINGQVAGTSVPQAIADANAKGPNPEIANSGGLSAFPLLRLILKANSAAPRSGDFRSISDMFAQARSKLVYNATSDSNLKSRSSRIAKDKKALQPKMAGFAMGAFTKKVNDLLAALKSLVGWDGAEDGIHETAEGSELAAGQGKRGSRGRRSSQWAGLLGGSRANEESDDEDLNITGLSTTLFGLMAGGGITAFALSRLRRRRGARHRKTESESPRRVA